jgi:hydroxymethylglutaryl-CoA reductase
MNGAIAVANATGQDSRAIEAAANAYAAHSGQYRSLTEWSKDQEGNLVGTLELPLSVGIVGGIINVHPLAKVCTKILGVTSAKELAGIITATGLAQNYSAIRALATEGIQKGHMKLHARNLAASAGANSQQIDEIVKKMIQENNISLNRAKELLDQI